MNVEWKDVTLKEAFEFIQQQTGVDLVVMWIDEDNPQLGLRPDRTISAIAKNLHVIDVIDKVLERADTRATGDGSTWQLSDSGTLQIGPRERLNKWTRTYAYDMADLFMPAMDMFDPDDALLKHGIQPTPALNPSTSLSHRRLAAGMHDERPFPERAEELRQIIMQTCEPKAWIENGGDAATIMLHRSSKAFVVRAPDYVHRAIDGYHDIPSRVIAPETSTPVKPPETAAQPGSSRPGTPSR